MKRIESLTALRFFAAAWVMLCHFPFPTKNLAEFAASTNPILRIFEKVYSSGYLGVSIFFALSSFVLSITFDPKSEYKNYLAKRLVRIYPVYFVIIVVLGVLATVRVPASVWLTHLSLTQIYFPSKYSALLVPSWSLCVEFSWYLVFPFIFRWSQKKSTKQLTIWSLAVWGVMILLNLAISISSFPMDLYHRAWLAFHPLFQIAPLFFGIVAFRLYQDKREFSWKLTSGLLLIIAVTLSLQGEIVDDLGNLILLKVLFAPIAGIIVFCVAKFLTVSRKNILVPLGEISYSLYLSHLPLLTLYKNQVGEVDTFAKFILLFIGCQVVAATLYYSVERPVGRAFRKRLDQNRTLRSNS